MFILLVKELRLVTQPTGRTASRTANTEPQTQDPPVNAEDEEDAANKASSVTLTNNSNIPKQEPSSIPAYMSFGGAALFGAGAMFLQFTSIGENSLGDGARLVMKNLSAAISAVLLVAGIGLSAIKAEPDNRRQSESS